MEGRMFPHWLRLDVAQIRAVLTVSNNGEADRRAINFDVHPSDDQEIRLASGEVFCHPKLHGLSRSKSLRKATGHLQIVEAVSAEPEWGLVTAMEASKDEDALISIHAFYTPLQFDALLANLRAGMLPEALTVATAENSKLNFGGDPDGNVLEWDNREKPAAIPITSIDILYRLGDPLSDPEANPGKSLRESSDINFEDRREVARAMVERLDLLESSVRNTRHAVLLVLVVLIIVLLFKR